MRRAVGRLPPDGAGLRHPHHVGAPDVERIVGPRLVARFDAAGAGGDEPAAVTRHRTHPVALLEHPLRGAAVRFAERQVPQFPPGGVDPHQPAVPAAAGAGRGVPGQDIAAPRRGVEVVGVGGAGAVGERRVQVALRVAEGEAEHGLPAAPAAGAVHGVAGRVPPRQHPERLKEAVAGAALPNYVQLGVQLHDEPAAAVHQERGQLLLRGAAVADRDHAAVGVQGDALDGVAPRARVGAPRRHRAVGREPQQHAIFLHRAAPGIPGTGDQQAAVRFFEHEVAQVDAARPVGAREPLRAALVGAHHEDAGARLAARLADDHEAAVGGLHRGVRMLLALRPAVAVYPLHRRPLAGRGALSGGAPGGQERRQQHEHSQARAAAPRKHRHPFTEPSMMPLTK